MTTTELDYYFYLERQQDKARCLLTRAEINNDEPMQQFFKSVIWGLRTKEQKIIKNLGF